MSDDLIRRSDAVAEIYKARTPDVASHQYAELFINAVCRAPSADRPQGEWKPKNHHTDYCSNCGFEETQWRTADYKFCPSCGVRMKGMDDEHTI